MTIWFTDIRRVALIAFVLSVGSTLIALRDFTGKLNSITFTHPQAELWLALVTALGYLIATIFPAFYFALYRNEGTLHFPKRLRLLALAAALVTGMMLVAGLPAWIRSIADFITASSLEWSTGAASVAFLRSPGSIYQLAALLGELTSLAQMLLLIAFFRWERSASVSDTPASKMLRLTTRIAFVSWGLVVAGAFVRLVALPFTVPQLQDVVIKAGRTPPPLSAFMGDAVRFLISQACLFAAPYVVYRSWSARSKESGTNTPDAVQPT